MNIVETFLEVALLGSAWVLWLLVVLSVVSVAIILERAWFFKKLSINFVEFRQKLLGLLIEGKISEAETFCKDQAAIEPQVALKGLESRRLGTHAMEETMVGYLIGERQHLDRGLVVLGTLGNNAPFIGLFGTVLGIIEAFHALKTNPAGGPSVVMAAISEALVATAVGLMVAIPAVVAFNFFNRLVKRRVANAESVMKLVSAHVQK